MTEAPTAQAAPEQAADLAQEKATDVVPGTSAAFALERRPAIDSVPERMVKLLEAKSPNLSYAELSQALELAVAYQLDPFANEIWFTKSRGRNGGEGRLLIMVGRDGLRKIAQRNGLEVDGDVVRANDTFEVKRGPDRRRVVEHTYVGGHGDRGPIIGAWAECWERKSGTQRGFFYAPVDEYKPADADARSVWSKQVSVMVLAAAERQAVRQATPLGGLLIEGEDVLVDERTGGAELQPGAEQPFDGYPLEGEIEAVLDAARERGHVGLSSVAAAQMALQGQDEDRVREWVEGAWQELGGRPEPGGEPEPEPEPEDAVVVEDEPQPAAAPLDEHSATAADAPPSEDDRVAALRDRAADLRADAESVDDGDERESMLGEADALESEADAIADATQTSLGDL